MKKVYIAPCVTRMFCESEEMICAGSQNRILNPDETGETNVGTDRGEGTGDAGSALSKEDWGGVGGGIWED